MLELLTSNLPPLKLTGFNTFIDAFYEQLDIHKEADIAVGYVSAESLAQLKRAVELYDVHKLNLTIGMHYIEKFTQLEYIAACKLNEFLKSNKLGAVKVVLPFKYHGKMYLYKNSGTPISAIIGSNNLSGIIDSKRRVYENSVLVNEKTMLDSIGSFINSLYKKAAKDINEIEIKEFKRGNKLLDGLEGVSSINDTDIASAKADKTGISFNIPITPFERAPKSNINTCYGAGRTNKRTGITIPRPWYEVELIVPKTIYSNPNYPKGSSFAVVTDDGYSFNCMAQGSIGVEKNFRSENDLEILGKWIKGKLVNAGVLNIGERVTKKVLDDYGRDYMTLKKLKNGKWFLDFEVTK